MKSPYFGDRRKAFMTDLAVVTGGQVVSEDVGLSLDSVGLEVLGTARRVTVDKETTTIVDGGGTSEGDRRPRRADPPRDRGDRLRLGPREAARSGWPSSPAASASSASARPPRWSSRSASTASRTPSRPPARRSRRGSSPAAARRWCTPPSAIDALDLSGDELTGARAVRSALDAPLVADRGERRLRGPRRRQQGARPRRRAGLQRRRPVSSATSPRRASSTRSRSPRPRWATPRPSRRWS